MTTVNHDMLAARAREGDDAAFAELHQRLHPRLRRYAGALLGERDADADDAVQEAWIRAHRALPRTRGELNVTAWLHAIVRNCCLDVLRRDIPAPAEGALAEFAGGERPDERLARAEALRAAVDDIGRLGPRQRAALVAHAVEGRSHASIAREEGVSEQTVRSLVARARRNLARRADARSLDCAEVRRELEHAAGRGRRPTEPVRLHLQTCAPCALHRTRARARVLFPLPKIAAGVATTFALGGATAALSIERREWREPAASPATPAWRLPAGFAFARQRVRLDAQHPAQPIPVRLRCPRGYGLWQFDTEGTLPAGAVLAHDRAERWLGRDATMVHVTLAPGDGPVSFDLWAACRSPRTLRRAVRGDRRLLAHVRRNLRSVR